MEECRGCGAARRGAVTRTRRLGNPLLRRAEERRRAGGSPAKAASSGTASFERPVSFDIPANMTCLCSMCGKLRSVAVMCGKLRSFAVSPKKRRRHVRQAKKLRRFTIRTSRLLRSLRGRVAPDRPAQSSRSLRCFHRCPIGSRPPFSSDHGRTSR